MIKELGDVAQYLAETAYALDVELEEVFVKNIEKLKKRYPEGFDENRSIQRKNDENPSENQAAGPHLFSIKINRIY